MITMGAVGAAFREQSTGSREWKLVKKVGHFIQSSVPIAERVKIYVEDIVNSDMDRNL